MTACQAGNPIPANDEHTSQSCLNFDLEIGQGTGRSPAGERPMGNRADDKDAYGDRKPQHRAHLDDHWIGKHPVTNTRYRAFAKAAGR